MNENQMINRIGELEAELEKSRKELGFATNILKKVFPEHSGHYFICGEVGEKDSNGLPKYIMICPAHGCDWHMLYERTEKAAGPEW
jgi:hypothetical protein